MLDSFRKQITTLRRRVLRRIDRQFVTSDIPVSLLIEAVCAFCLATSSSSNDAVTHFQNIRLDTMGRLLESDGRSADKVENANEAIQFFVQTLRTTKALLGRQLSDAFRTLTSQRLIQDHSLQALEELALDSYGICIPSEVQNYVPWIKYTEISRSDANQTCRAWSQKAFVRFLTGLTTCLKEVSTVDTVLKMRQSLLTIWLENWSAIPTHSPSTILESLRKTFNDRICKIFELEAASVTDITFQLERAMTQISSEVHDLSLWSTELATSSASNGASDFREDLKRRHLGLSEQNLELTDSMAAWISKIQGSKATLTRISDVKWSVIIADEEDEFDDDDDEDETDNTGFRLTVRSIEKLLRDTDMQELSAAAAGSLESAMSSLQGRLLDISKSSIGNPNQSTQLDALTSCVFLRAIRSITRLLTSSFPAADLQRLHPIIAVHHSRIASHVADQFFAKLPKSRSRVSMHHLFEAATSEIMDGEPAAATTNDRLLPNIPHPIVMKLLRLIIMEMARLGPDLWTTAAVSRLKEIIWSRLFSRNLDQLARLIPLAGNPNEVNGFKVDPSTPHAVPASNGDHGQQTDDQAHQSNYQSLNTEGTMHKEQEIQAIYDYLYLQQALGRPSDSALSSGKDSSKYYSLDEVRSNSGLSPAAFDILEQRSKEYWSRTSLLFGSLQQS